MSEPVDTGEQVSVESHGRVLSGVGVTEDALRDVMARHEPEASDAETDGASDATAETPAAAAEIAAVGVEPLAFKQPRGAKRIDQLTAEREAAKREADSYAKERDELKARLAVLEAKGSPAASAVPVAPEPPTTRDEPSEDDIGTKYKTYGEYVKDVARWEHEQLIAKIDFDAQIRTRIEADRASRSFRDVLSQTWERGAKVYPDFDTVRQNGPGAGIPLGHSPEQGRDRVQYIVNLPNSEHVQYAIAKDADLAQKLAKASDFEFGVLIASVAPAMSVASPASTGSPVIVPKPYQPVGTGSSTASVPSSSLTQKSGFDFDKSGYREKRKEERKRLGR